MWGGPPASDQLSKPNLAFTPAVKRLLVVDCMLLGMEVGQLQANVPSQDRLD